MLNIFNEKTVAALQIDGYEETATFVHHVTRLFHMLNVKDLYSGQAYNDPDREPYTAYPLRFVRYDAKRSLRGRVWNL